LFLGRHRQLPFRLVGGRFAEVLQRRHLGWAAVSRSASAHAGAACINGRGRLACFGRKNALRAASTLPLVSRLNIRR
jgi:hypothetical protein